MARSTIISKGLRLGIWELETGNLFASVANPSGAERYAISPDGKQVAVVTINGQTMSFWDLPAGKLVKTVKLSVKKDISFPPFVVYSQHGKSVLTVTGKTFIRVNLDSWQEEALLTDLNTEGVAYSPAKNILVECRYRASIPTSPRFVCSI